MKLYLDIDGVLLTKKNTRPADHALPFLYFAIENFECCWLTTHCKGDSRTALKYLAQFFDAIAIERAKQIKPTDWQTLKTEAIDLRVDFFWLDDNPLQAEIEIIKAVGKINRLLLVDLNQPDEVKATARPLNFSRMKLFASAIFASECPMCCWVVR